MRRAISGCVLVLCCSLANAALIHVGADGTGSFPTIQEAIDAAADGDEIVLAVGTYTGEGNKNLSLGGKTITLRSTNPGSASVVAATIIDCEGQGRAFRLYATYETPATVIDGLTITNANESGIQLYRSSPTIRRCIIRNNSNDGSGGGIWSRLSGAQVIECRIVENSSGEASGTGGGIYLDRPSGATIAHCTVSRNVSLYYGGGIECSRSGDAVIRNCLITDNTTVYHSGAGISIWYNSSPVIANCVVSGNLAHGTFADGGGICCSNGSNPTLRGCLVMGNEATESGGGIYATCPMRIQHCTIVDNWAGGTGGGIHCCGGEAELSLSNSILWDNTSPGLYGRQLVVAGSGSWGFAAAEVGYSNVQGGQGSVVVDPGATLDWGSGNISGAPLFADADWRVSGDSPCVDAGDPNWTPDAGETDLDGHTRVLCGLTDMGAYEFGIGDHNCDGLVDWLDFAAWPGCATGPIHGPHPPDCEAFDVDADADVDLADFGGLQEVFGVGIP